MSDNSIFNILTAATYAAWTSNLIGGVPVAHDRFKWFQDFKPGDLVMETSTVFMRSRDKDRFGFLVSAEREPMFSDEEWETLKDDYDNERPTELAYRIKLLVDRSTEYRWTNASFIRVPESPMQFSDIGRAKPKN